MASPDLSWIINKTANGPITFAIHVTKNFQTARELLLLAPKAPKPKLSHSCRQIKAHTRPRTRPVPPLNRCRTQNRLYDRIDKELMVKYKDTHNMAPKRGLLMDKDQKAESPLLESLREANIPGGRYEHTLLGLLKRRRQEREAERRRLALLKIAGSVKRTSE